MQLKTSRIAFAIEDKSGKRYLQPRVVVTLTVDDVIVGGADDQRTPITELRHEVEQVVASQTERHPMPLPFLQTLADEKVHVVSLQRLRETVVGRPCCGCARERRHQPRSLR